MSNATKGLTKFMDSELGGGMGDVLGSLASALPAKQNEQGRTSTGSKILQGAGSVVSALPIPGAQLIGPALSIVGGLLPAPIEYKPAAEASGFAKGGRIAKNSLYPGHLRIAKTGKLGKKKLTKKQKTFFNWAIPEFDNWQEGKLGYTGGGKLTYKLYEETTGESWRTAKQKGLTDGSAAGNLALRQRLLNNEFGPATQAAQVATQPAMTEVNPLPRVPLGTPVTSTGTPNAGTVRTAGPPPSNQSTFSVTAPTPMGGQPPMGAPEPIAFEVDSTAAPQVQKGVLHPQYKFFEYQEPDSVGNIKNYQETESLPITGYLGEQTIKNLQKEFPGQEPITSKKAEYQEKVRAAGNKVNTGDFFGMDPAQQEKLRTETGNEPAQCIGGVCNFLKSNVDENMPLYFSNYTFDEKAKKEGWELKTKPSQGYPEVGSIIQVRDKGSRHAMLVTDFNPETKMYTIVDNAGGGEARKREFGLDEIINKSKRNQEGTKWVWYNKRFEDDNKKTGKISFGYGRKEFENMFEGTRSYEYDPNFNLRIEPGAKSSKSEKRYVEGIEDALKDLKGQNFKPEDVERLGILSAALAGRESDFGTGDRYKAKKHLPMATRVYRMFSRNQGLDSLTDPLSAGLSQIDPTMISDEIREKYFKGHKNDFSKIEARLFRNNKLAGKVTADMMVERYKDFQSNPNKYGNDPSLFWYALTKGWQSPNFALAEGKKGDENRESLKNMNISYVDEVFDDLSRFRVEKKARKQFGGPVGETQYKNLLGTGPVQPYLNPPFPDGKANMNMGGIFNNMKSKYNQGGNPQEDQLNVIRGGRLRKLSPSTMEVEANDPNAIDSVELEQAYVSENETITKLPDGSKYVFSDSLTNPYSGKTFADDDKALARLEGTIAKKKSKNSPQEKATLKYIDFQRKRLSTLNDKVREFDQLQNQQVMGKQAFNKGGRPNQAINYFETMAGPPRTSPFPRSEGDDLNRLKRGEITGEEYFQNFMNQVNAVKMNPQHYRPVPAYYNEKILRAAGIPMGAPNMPPPNMPPQEMLYGPGQTFSVPQISPIKKISRKKNNSPMTPLPSRARDYKNISPDEMLNRGPSYNTGNIDEALQSLYGKPAFETGGSWTRTDTKAKAGYTPKVKQDISDAKLAGKSALKAGAKKLIPFVSTALYAAEARERAKEGNYPGAAMSAGLGLLGLVPGVGTAGQVFATAAAEGLNSGMQNPKESDALLRANTWNAAALRTPVAKKTEPARQMSAAEKEKTGRNIMQGMGVNFEAPGTRDSQGQGATPEQGGGSRSGGGSGTGSGGGSRRGSGSGGSSRTGGGSSSGEKAYQTYERLTGKKWSTAVAEGLTDGTAAGNLALQKKLLAGQTTTPDPAASPTQAPQVNPAGQVDPAVDQATPQGTPNQRGLQMVEAAMMNREAILKSAQDKWKQSREQSDQTLQSGVRENPYPTRESSNIRNFNEGYMPGSPEDYQSFAIPEEQIRNQLAQEYGKPEFGLGGNLLKGLVKMAGKVAGKFKKTPTPTPTTTGVVPWRPLPVAAPAPRPPFGWGLAAGAAGLAGAEYLYTQQGNDPVQTPTPAPQPKPEPQPAPVDATNPPVDSTGGGAGGGSRRRGGGGGGAGTGGGTPTPAPAATAPLPDRTNWTTPLAPLPSRLSILNQQAKDAPMADLKARLDKENAARLTAEKAKVDKKGARLNLLKDGLPNVLQFAELAGKTAMLAKGYDRNMVNTAPISYRPLDPAQAMMQNQYAYNAALDQVQNASSGANQMANIQNLAATNMRGNNMIQSQYDQQNQQLYRDYEARLGQRDTENINYAHNVGQANKAAFYGAIDNTFTSIGNIGRAGQLRLDSEKAAKTLAEGFPQIQPYIVNMLANAGVDVRGMAGPEGQYLGGKLKFVKGGKLTKSKRKKKK